MHRVSVLWVLAGLLAAPALAEPAPEAPPAKTGVKTEQEVETSSRSEAPEAERSEAMEASRDRAEVAVGFVVKLNDKRRRLTIQQTSQKLLSFDLGTVELEPGITIGKKIEVEHAAGSRRASAVALAD